jgi:thiamine kinase-like enzyme
MKRTITIDNAASYCIENGFIDKKSIVDSDLELIDVSRKNRNIKVQRKKGISYILKQSRSPDRYRAKTLQNEARLYSLAIYDPDFSSLRQIVPSLIEFTEDSILVLELVKGSSVWEYVRNHQREEFSAYPFAVLGTIMGNYHKRFKGIISSPKASIFPRIFPPVLLVSKPPLEIFCELSQANFQLLKIIQKYPDIHTFLKSVPLEWRVETLIHGDIRWDNILISYENSKVEDQLQMTIVDWEMADLGDPAWDLGRVIQEFVSFWLFSVSKDGSLDESGNLLASNSNILQNMQLAIRTFWKSYTEVADIKGAKSDELLTRSIRYGVAQLIQTAYDSQHWLSRPLNASIRILQVSQNIIHNQDDAITDLLGISFGG